LLAGDGILCRMPPQQRKTSTTSKAPTPAGRSRVCTAHTTSGERCKRQAVAGLTVCKSHGGGTAASVRSGKRSAVSQQAATLWGISSGTGSISVEEELTKLARNKLTDILALRLELSREGTSHIGMLVDSREKTSAEVSEDVFVTLKVKRSAGVSPWVNELHKAEQELIQILRLLQDVTGGTEEVDVRLKAFPGISVDDLAAEVSKRAS
jgi:hypothetical protein